MPRRWGSGSRTHRFPEKEGLRLAGCCSSATRVGDDAAGRIVAAQDHERCSSIIGGLARSQSTPLLAPGSSGQREPPRSIGPEARRRYRLESVRQGRERPRREGFRGGVTARIVQRWFVGCAPRLSHRLATEAHRSTRSRPGGRVFHRATVLEAPSAAVGRGPTRTPLTGEPEFTSMFDGHVP